MRTDVKTSFVYRTQVREFREYTTRNGILHRRHRAWNMKKNRYGLSLTIRNSSYIIILRSKLGGGYLKGRKKPGPHPEKPLAHDLKVRVDDEKLAKVQFCMKELNMTRSEVLRKGVDTLYDWLLRK